METMEPGQHEKGGAVNAGVQRQSVQHLRFVILRRLQAEENQRQADGNAEPAIKLYAVSGEDRGVRDMHRRTR